MINFWNHETQKVLKKVERMLAEESNISIPPGISPRVPLRILHEIPLSIFLIKDSCRDYFIDFPRDLFRAIHSIK